MFSLAGEIMIEEEMPRLTQKQAAEYLRRSQKTLEGWRSRDRGPAYFRVVGKIMYRKCDLDSWLLEQMVIPTAGTARRAAIEAGA